MSKFKLAKEGQLDSQIHQLVPDFPHLGPSKEQVTGNKTAVCSVAGDRG